MGAIPFMRVWMNGKSIGCNPIDLGSIPGSRSTYDTRKDKQ